MLLETDFINRLEHNNKLYIGYPPSTDFTLNSLGKILNYSINNLGDPITLKGSLGSHEFEKEVVEFFMKLYKTDSHTSWGYIANCSTEAALYCCWRAREYMKKYKSECVIVASEYSHYCIGKIADIVGLDLIYVSSSKDGSIDNEKLEEALFKNKHKSIIFFATLGSTITSSIDDIKAFKNIATNANINFYIHADAAFDGAFLPFIEDYSMCKDFDSINISGHKFIGCPIPSGILLINRKYIQSNKIEYVPNFDVTIGGSRNGVTPVLLYEQIKKLGGESGLKERYYSCLKKAEEFKEIAINRGLNAWKVDHAITLVLDRVDDIVMEKWLAPTYKEYTTITALPRLTQEKFSSFLKDVLHVKNHGSMRDNVKTLYPSLIAPL